MTTLDEIQARADVATQGPWHTRHCPPCTELGRLEVNIWDTTGNFLITSWCDEDDDPGPDAEFIAHAREDVPRLVAALKAVEAVEAPTGDDYTFDLGYAAALDKVRNTIREALGA